MKRFLIVLFVFFTAQSWAVTATNISGYEAYSEGNQMGVYEYSVNGKKYYFMGNATEYGKSFDCDYCDGTDDTDPKTLFNRMATESKDICSSPNYSTMTCYQGKNENGGVTDSANDGTQDSSSSSSSSSQTIKRNTEDKARATAYDRWSKAWVAVYNGFANEYRAIQEWLANRTAYCAEHYRRGSVQQKECSDAAKAYYEKTKADIDKRFNDAKSIESAELSKLNEGVPDANAPGNATPHGGATITEITSGSSGGSDSSNSGSSGGSGGSGTSGSGGSGGHTTVNNNTVNNYHNNTYTGDSAKSNSILQGISKSLNDIKGLIAGSKKEEAVEDKKPEEKPASGEEGGGEWAGNNDDVSSDMPNFDLSKFAVTKRFDTTASCPAPMLLDLGFLGRVEITYHWFCELAKYLRSVVIAFAWLSALFIIVRSRN